MQLRQTAPFRAHHHAASHAARPVRVVMRPQAAAAAAAAAGSGSSSSSTSTSGSSGPLGAPPALVAAGAALTLIVSPLQLQPAAAFGPVSVQLKDLHINHQTVQQIDCGAGVASVGGVTFSGSSQKPACLQVTAQAVNPSKGSLFDADVFGRVYDKNGEAAIDDTENIRIAYLDEVKPGTSSVSFKLYVPLEQYNLGPLELVGFKASGFPGRNLPASTGGTVSAQQAADCAITGDCDDLEAEAAIR